VKRSVFFWIESPLAKISLNLAKNMNHSGWRDQFIQNRVDYYPVKCYFGKCNSGNCWIQMWSKISWCRQMWHIISSTTSIFLKFQNMYSQILISELFVGKIFWRTFPKSVNLEHTPKKFNLKIHLWLCDELVHLFPTHFFGSRYLFVLLFYSLLI
jgi:hypothetical protein